MKKLWKSLAAVALTASLAGCGSSGSGDEKTITIGASVTPHAEIIENIKPDLEELGYEVEIVEFSDYVKPNTALRDGELGGREKLHFIQSFNPEDNLTYETAHEIANKMANEFFNGFQVVVATHQDTEHIHSHFVVNSVNFETGKKIQFSQKELERLKQYSNKLCMQYGLSISQEKAKVDDIKINEYKAKQKGISWKETLEKDIDLAMGKAKNKHEFFKIMNSLGYKVTWTKERKNITYTTPLGYKCRDRKLHNEKYLKGNRSRIS